jgi:hypothetical protein
VQTYNTTVTGTYGISPSVASQNLANVSSPVAFEASRPIEGYNHAELSYLMRLDTSAADRQPPLIQERDSQYTDASSQISSPKHNEIDYAYLRYIKIQSRDEILACYNAAFHSLQQTNCRLIAKAFIKAVEPKKQTRYPYNGGKKGPNGETGDPEKTKPSWWPAGVTHREPDHLKKSGKYSTRTFFSYYGKLTIFSERIRLLIYILRREGLLTKRHATTKRLQQFTSSIRQRVRPAERLEILDEIFRVRRLEEEYENGKIGVFRFIH